MQSKRMWQGFTMHFKEHWFCLVPEMGNFFISFVNTKYNEKSVHKKLFLFFVFNNTLLKSIKAFQLCLKVCPNSHTADKWCSQPVLNRGLHAGDLMIASAILFSGNNFSKIELFSQFLNLGFLSASSFTRLQRNYLVPSVDDLWSEKKRNMVQEFRNNNLVLLGNISYDIYALAKYVINIL